MGWISDAVHPIVLHAWCMGMGGSFIVLHGLFMGMAGVFASLAG